VADADNAAALHEQAGAMIAADKAFGAEDSPLVKRGDPLAPEATAVLTRHAATLDLIRRATDRDACRFARDWTRPSFDMLLPEVQTFRSEGRLLALAARHAAAEGRGGDALADVVRLGRLSRHAAAEPILISYLVGVAVDTQALQTLADVLPSLTPTDRAALERVDVKDLVGDVPNLTRALYGEEAFGLSVFADFTDGTMASHHLAALDAGNDGLPVRAAAPALGAGFRVFFLPADLAGYRGLMHRYQQLAGRQPPPTFAEIKRETDAIERDVTAHPPGVLSRLIVPAIGSVFRTRARALALHRAAAVLVAATRDRLADGAVPAALDGLMPIDPFADGEPMLTKRTDAGLAVYSVGPDGEDDGGPVPPGAENVDGNDDVGLVMVAAP
jgi:hypothetical protein